MKTKKFNCVEMKHRGATEILKQTSQMSREEEVAFWKERTERLRRLQEKIKKVQQNVDVSS